jgi:hypothetical protein
MDLGKIELGGVDWIGLSRVRNRWRALVNADTKLKINYISG